MKNNISHSLIILLIFSFSNYCHAYTMPDSTDIVYRNLNADVDSALSRMQAFYSNIGDYHMEFRIIQNIDSSETIVTDTCKYFKYQNYYYGSCGNVIEMMNDSVILQINHIDSIITVVPFSPESLEDFAIEVDFNDLLMSIHHQDSIVYELQTDSSDKITIISPNGLYPKMEIGLHPYGALKYWVFYMPLFSNIFSYIYEYIVIEPNTHIWSFMNPYIYIQTQGNTFVPTSTYQNYSIKTLKTNGYE